MKKSPPAIVSITSRCNSRCVFCLDGGGKGVHLSTSESKAVIRDLHEKYNPGRIMFMGGETFLRSDCLEIMDFIKSLGTKTGVATNGTPLSDRKYVETLFSKGLDYVEFSIHGHNKETAESISRVPGSWERQLAALENLSRLNSENPKPGGIEIHFNVVICRQNHKNITDVIRLVESRSSRLDSVNLKYIRPEGLAFRNRDMVPEYSEAAPFIMDAAEYCKKKSINVVVESVPFCVVRGYEHRCREIAWTTGNILNIWKPGRVADKISPLADYSKAEACIKCSLVDLCPGILSGYMDMYKMAVSPSDANPHDIIKRAEYDGPKEFIGGNISVRREPAYLQVTRMCNNECVFCSNPQFECSAGLDGLKKDVNDFRRMGVTELVLTGGEPMMFGGLPELIGFIRDSGMTPKVITNGVELSDKKLAARLFESGLADINISVHSEDASIADRLSQRPGHFEKTLKGIRNSIDSGMHVTINSTINSLNCRRLPMFADFMTRSFPEVRHYVFNNLDPGKADGRLRSRAGDNQWVVARLVDFEIELKAALDLLAAKGKTFRVERVPLCYMQGYEEFSTETRKIVKGEKYMCMFLEYGGGKNLRVVAPSSRRVKSDACKACGLESVCAGLDSGYAKIHGVGEIYPVFYDPEWVGVRVKKNE